MQKRRTYSPELKKEAIERLQQGQESASEIENALDITAGLLSRWKRDADKSAETPTTNGSSDSKAPSNGTHSPAAEQAELQEEHKIDLHNSSFYINRELSQIEFNRRVLGESNKQSHPLLERAKFIAIFASNMDEFFMVRVSGLKQQVALGITDVPADGLTPREQLIAIHKVTTKLIQDEMESWQSIKVELNKNGIQIRHYDDLKSSRKRKLSQYFEREIFPALTPLTFDPSHPFPHISNLSLNLAVVIRDPETNATRFARVKVPTTLPRLVPLRQVAPDDLVQPSTQKFVWVEEVIKANLGRLFPGMEIVDAYPFRITRNNDMEIQEEEADDLLLSIEENLRKRHFGNVVRLEIDASMPDSIRDMLMHNFDIGPYDLYTNNGPLALTSLWGLHSVERPDLKDDIFFPKHPPPLRTGNSIFSVLQQQDVLIHRPFDSFSDVSDFIDAAADDPAVIAIKITLYRVGNNPTLINALMRARGKDKQVAALVELKARFDEESNITWARHLERAGVHVVYGVIGLKVHAKMCLVIRRERGGLKRYLHLSTGNYNVSTARTYEDIDFLTSDEAMGADASDVFNFLTGFSKQRDYSKFLVAPISLREQIRRAIKQETKLGSAGHIIFKLNSLVDAQMIRALYRASQAGVKIDLIVRGICCLRTGIKGVSDNIRVISIVGRFLEHSRIFYFKNQGSPIIYSGSADMMQRNLDRRVEVLFPIEDKTLKAEIVENLLAICLRDTAQAHEMQSDGSYIALATTLAEDGKENSDLKLFNSQEWFLKKRTTLQLPMLSPV